jgi:hypothetical protein
MRRLPVLFAILLLSGCSLFSKPEADFSCPTTGMVEDASRVTVMAADAKSIAAEGAITGYNGTCSFKNKDTADMELVLPFAVRKGAGGQDLKEIELPYFVAVLSPDETILQRQAFTTKIEFDDTGHGLGSETHRIQIPGATGETAYKYKVVVGFALTQDQLKYNKGHR